LSIDYYWTHVAGVSNWRRRTFSGSGIPPLCKERKGWATRDLQFRCLKFMGHRGSDAKIVNHILCRGGLFVSVSGIGVDAARSHRPASASRASRKRHGWRNRCAIGGQIKKGCWCWSWSCLTYFAGAGRGDFQGLNNVSCSWAFAPRYCCFAVSSLAPGIIRGRWVDFGNRDPATDCDGKN
jgi:hypothetical protein